MIIGVISDTHGLLREEVINNLSDCQLIIHAGDIGNGDIIKRLEEITNTIFVYGNIDKVESFDAKEKIIEVNDTRIYLIHNIKDIKCDLKGKKVNIVVYGHSHKSKINVEDDILYLNPGSIGPRRFKLGTTMMKLYIEEDIVDYDFKFERYKVKIININV